MKRDAALDILRRHQQELAALGVRGLYLYGSVARDEADEHSDVDLLVDIDADRYSFSDLIRVHDACTEALGVYAETHHYGGYLRLPEFRSRVEPDLVRVF